MCIGADMACAQAEDPEKLLRTINESQIGYDSTVSGPFGPRRGGYYSNGDGVHDSSDLCAGSRYYTVIVAN